MASADVVFPEAECCEICGAVLGDEIVIQEFADGSLARLCQECAAGANVDDGGTAHSKPRDSFWPAVPPPSAGTQPADSDPLEKTRELLMPVADLIALQGEMQSALQRLASSLERFAAEMITESQDKTAVESRLQSLEQELDKTRTKLSEAEFLLTAAVEPGSAPAAPAEPSPPVVTVTESIAAAQAIPWPEAEAPATPLPDAEAPAIPWPEPEASDIAWPESEPVVPAPAASGAGKITRRWRAAKGTPAEPPKAGRVVAPPAASGAAEVPADTKQPSPQTHGDRLPTFRIEEVQAAQRYYNDSAFINRVRDVRRSLGKPKANLTRLPGDEPRAVVTVAWDIVWYQYLVDLRRDLPSGMERVTLHREGMDLDELAFHFREKNSVINDDGRLDASELEVLLLSDPSALITEMTPEETAVLEDATEEIWDQRIAPEFKWDD